MVSDIRSLVSVILAVLVAGLGLWPAASLAGQGEFVLVTPEAQMRLISSDRADADGTVLAGIEFAMPPTSRTYWYVPGETGIPLTMDHTQSTGISDAQILWPLPTRELVGTFTDHVYAGDTIIPVRLTLDGARANWSAKLWLGICDTVCVPVSVTLDLPIDTSAPDAATALALRQAEARVPIEMPASELLRRVPEFDLASGLLTLQLTDRQVEAASLIIAIGHTSSVFSGLVPAGPGLWQARLLARNTDVMREPSDLRLFFDTADGPYYVSSPVVLTNQD